MANLKTGFPVSGVSFQDHTQNTLGVLEINGSIDCRCVFYLFYSVIRGMDSLGGSLTRKRTEYSNVSSFEWVSFSRGFLS